MMLRKNQLNTVWRYFNPSLHTLVVSAHFISLSGIPYIYPICKFDLIVSEICILHLYLFEKNEKLQK